MNILLIEDDIDIASNVGQYFESKGHTLDFAYDGNTGLELALSHNFDLIILDLMLPNKDGIELTREYRQQSPKYTSILMLTARDTVEDKVQGFEAGADDYLVKPFSLRELEARINALEKRQQRIQHSQLLEVHDLTLNIDDYSVMRSGHTITLKPKTFNILKLLMANTERVITRQEIINSIWPNDLPEGDPLRVHIHNLRQKIDSPFEQPLIHTIHGVGYRLFAPSKPNA